VFWDVSCLFSCSVFENFSSFRSCGNAADTGISNLSSVVLCGDVVHFGGGRSLYAR